jgi:hypothetical protein
VLGHNRLRWQALILAAAAAAVVVITAAPAAAQDRCGLPTASSWTPAETMVWQQLCAGQLADFNVAGEILDPNQPDGWDERRMLSSAFIEQLLTEPYAALIDRHGIYLSGAWFPDGLNIYEAPVSFSLRCLNCRIAELLADYAVIDGTVDCLGLPSKATSAWAAPTSNLT